MRVMLTPWPNPAHLYPIVPLAWALQSAGHEVCIASHAALAPRTAGVGLPALALGDSSVTPIGPGNPWPAGLEAKFERMTEQLALNPFDREQWDIYYQFMLPSMWDFQPYGASPEDPHRELDELVAFARNWQPDLVLWDPCLPIGAIAAKACGAAHGRMLWGLDYFAYNVDRVAERLGKPGGPTVDPLAETMRPGALRHGVEVDDELLVGQFTVDPTPIGMRLPTTTRTVSIRWEPFSAQTPIPEWLYEPLDRPRIGLTLGLSQRLFFKDGWEHVAKLMDMVADLDVEVVATLNSDQLACVGRLPDNVRTIDYLPLNQLLPTCSALIHQGGLGTFAAASALSVPQLIIDFEVDNGTTVVVGEDGVEQLATEKHTESSLTANYVIQRGAGLPLDIRQPVADMQKQLVRILTEPSFQEGAASIYQDTVASPTPNHIVPVLERLAAQYRRR
jgi:hypothetical protein